MLCNTYLLKNTAKWHKLIVLCAITFSWQSVTIAQEATQEDIKVGLVLSGGGAKGLAHVGAIKVIEEAGVKIDYIGGTSMGAIVGGLYAAGYNSQQLDSIFRYTDFADLIQDKMPRTSKSSYERDVTEKYALSLPFNNLKVTFPQAYSGGQKLYNELVKALYHVKDVGDFTKLSIPFVCIATDIENGEKVILDRGYLPEAIMASGTLPSLFEPAQMGSQILIDGGVVNNYPINEVRKMGADFIIGVDVQEGLKKREDLDSASEILLQINNYRSVLDMVDKVKDTDIYIKPKTNNYSVIAFDEGQTIVKIGADAAREKFTELQKVALRQNKEREKIKPVTVNDTILVKQLVLNGNENFTRGYVKGKLRFNLNEPISFGQLQEGINNLSATSNFKTIRYELLTNGDGVDLVIQLRETPIKTYLRLGAHYDDLYKTAALVNLSHKHLLFKDDVVTFDFIFGDNLRYNFHYFVDKGSYWSFGLNSSFNKFKKDVPIQLLQSNFNVPSTISNINSANLDVEDFTNQFYLQTVLNQKYSFRLGVEQKHLKYSSRTLGDTVENLTGLNIKDGRTVFDNSNYFSLFGQLALDTYDDMYFPTKGLFFNGDFHFYIGSSDYNNNFKEFSVGKATLGTAITLADKLSLNVETSGGFKFGTSGVTTMDFILGGFGTKLINNYKSFYGYDFLSLPGNSFVKAYARLDFEFTSNNHLLFASNFANIDDDLFRTGEWFTAPTYTGYGLGYGLESLVGPIQLYYTWSPEVKGGNFFFSLGYWF